MGKVHAIWFNSRQLARIERLREEKGMASFAEAAKYLMFAEPVAEHIDFKQYEKKTADVETTALQKRFNEMLKERQTIHTKEKKHMSWAPARFHNDIRNLLENSVDPAEIVMFAARTKKLSIIAKELMERGIGLEEYKQWNIDWDAQHWKDGAYGYARHQQNKKGPVKVFSERAN